ncbi:hypothetical protein Fmac_020949 [Flemingia macrophylla]|uniref:Uncharacterized protein n=1 Tax=Flemingia macrophylla TaxID=520843 RepID=A0ABD1LVE3_9FABA
MGPSSIRHGQLACPIVHKSAGHFRNCRGKFCAKHLSFTVLGNEDDFWKSPILYYDPHPLSILEVPKSLRTLITISNNGLRFVKEVAEGKDDVRRFINKLRGILFIA